MEKDNLISVIVPVYKKNYLDRCIKSLTDQTYKNLQIVLIDDGSEDGSIDICKKWKEKDDRIILLEKDNGGVASARNVGIEYVINNNLEGYMTFIDDDDFMADDGIEIMYQLIKRTFVDIVWADFYVMNAETGEIENTEQNNEEWVMDSYDILMNEKWRTSYSLVWGKLFKVSVWKEIRLPEFCKAYDDGATTFKLLYNVGKVAVTKKKVLYYFLSSQGITRNKMTESRCREALFTQTEKIKFYQQKQEKQLYRMAFVAYINDILNNMVYSVGFDNKKMDFFKEMRTLYRKNVPHVMLAKVSIREKLRYVIYFIRPELVVKRNSKE